MLSHIIKHHKPFALLTKKVAIVIINHTIIIIHINKNLKEFEKLILVESFLIWNAFFHCIESVLNKSILSHIRIYRLMNNT